VGNQLIDSVPIVALKVLSDFRYPRVGHLIYCLVSPQYPYPMTPVVDSFGQFSHKAQRSAMQ
jgi:hypothetical protein